MNEIILCIDDEEDILDLIELNLNNAFNANGYEVIGCLNADMARRFLQKEHIALILVDRNLVGEDGLDFIKEIKESGYDVPVIIVSALSLFADRVKGLHYADDYVTKPFNFEELIARIQAVLRRYKKDVTRNIIKYKNISLEISNKELFIENVNIQLSPLETRIMQCFMENAGKTLSRDFFLKNVWDKKTNHQENSVNVAIKRLRKKIEKENKEIKIKSVRNEGYKLC
ncbi:DNA-binding response regulator [Helicobacter didelphidarum]|uniref:DNA-binding response regulator n=1 Tax=Helicobacter didelphidarum TaxID=2040648 RepID=A0A3D8IPG0_9HELI|nr:response regulator transcription factor [Helicobacter didelphidarum]RDU67102.1 DNA-binding response regulator [Helicobacter didelphidarum]